MGGCFISKIVRSASKSEESVSTSSSYSPIVSIKLIDTQKMRKAKEVRQIFQDEYEKQTNMNNIVRKKSILFDNSQV